MFMIVTKDSKNTNGNDTPFCSNYGTCKKFVDPFFCTRSSPDTCRKVRILVWIQNPATGAMIPFYDTEDHYTGPNLLGGVKQPSFRNVFGEPMLQFNVGTPQSVGDKTITDVVLIAKGPYSLTGVVAPAAGTYCTNDVPHPPSTNSQLLTVSTNSFLVASSTTPSGKYVVMFVANATSQATYNQYTRVRMTVYERNASFNLNPCSYSPLIDKQYSTGFAWNQTQVAFLDEYNLVRQLDSRSLSRITSYLQNHA